MKLKTILTKKTIKKIKIKRIQTKFNIKIKYQTIKLIDKQAQ